MWWWPRKQIRLAFCANLASVNGLRKQSIDVESNYCMANEFVWAEKSHMIQFRYSLNGYYAFASPPRQRQKVLFNTKQRSRDVVMLMAQRRIHKYWAAAAEKQRRGKKYNTLMISAMYIMYSTFIIIFYGTWREMWFLQHHSAKLLLACSLFCTSYYPQKQ